VTPDRLLCEHPIASATRKGYRIVCGVCGSFWDLDSLAAEPAYDADYPEKRGHFDPTVGALKVRSLDHWVRVSGAKLTGAHVCEVGFGGGSCLPYLAERARKLTGLEANQVTIDHARGLGVKATLLDVRSLPKLEEPVDLWLFQDSFEHIPDPTAFMRWMVENSSPRGEILIVLPRADSLSRKLLGRFWPHKLPVHQFHRSRLGVIDFMRKHGFEPAGGFFPLKYASPQMILAHFLHKLGAPARLSAMLRRIRFAIPINFGETGLRLRRSN
jgi:SAM-dependent methyltransferase